MGAKKVRKIVIETDEQYAAYALTKLIAILQPEIDEEVTYDVLCQAMDNGLSPENAEEYAALIMDGSCGAPSEKDLH